MLAFLVSKSWLCIQFVLRSLMRVYCARAYPTGRDAFYLLFDLIFSCLKGLCVGPSMLHDVCPGQLPDASPPLLGALLVRMPISQLSWTGILHAQSACQQPWWTPYSTTLQKSLLYGAVEFISRWCPSFLVRMLPSPPPSTPVRGVYWSRGSLCRLCDRYRGVGTRRAAVARSGRMPRLRLRFG